MIGVQRKEEAISLKILRLLQIMHYRL